MKLPSKIFNSKNFSKADVVLAYKLFLNREPESELVVENKVNSAKNKADLIDSFLLCDEYQRTLTKNDRKSVKKELRKFRKIESDISSSLELEMIFDNIQSTWKRLGVDDPFWSVISAEEYRQDRIDEQAIKCFYDSGANDLDSIEETLSRNEQVINNKMTCVEIGCGLGRVSWHLAKKFKQVYAFDISKNHIKYALNKFKNIPNLNFCQIKKINEFDSIPKNDFIYSVIVLQHNPPPIIKIMLEKILNSLNPNGIAYIQIPTYGENYEFILKRYLENDLKKNKMEMHCLSQKEIFLTIYKSNCILLEVFEDTWTGLNNGISNTFIIRKLPKEPV